LYINTRNDFMIYTDRIIHEAKCSHAVKDIDDDLFELIIAEVSLRRMYVESEIDISAKKMLQQLLTRNEIKAVGKRLGESIKSYCVEAWRFLRESTDNKTDDVSVRV
jgi:hypothetical protein